MSMTETNEPQIDQRGAQPYVAIRARVNTEAEFRRAADTGFPELFGWLRARGVEPAGPLFIRYRAVDGDGQPREVDLAVPVADEVPGDGRVAADVLPSGRWLTLRHVGPYRSTTTPDLGAARTTLRAWADEQGVALDIRETDGGTALGGCIEHYLIGPHEEPDHSKWETELAYLTAR
jgi:effector-binding domain-containing protein